MPSQQQQQAGSKKEMAHHQQRGAQSERVHDCQLFRYVLLFLLMLTAASSVLKLANSSVSPSSPLLQPSNSYTAGKGSESLKTHMPSNKNHLQAHEGKGSSKALLCSALIDGHGGAMENQKRNSSSSDEGLLCCDRSHERTDLCYMKGDIRTDSQSSSILLYGTAINGNKITTTADEKIRPYTRKWEKEIMNTVDQITLRPVPVPAPAPAMEGGNCSVRHSTPAIVFSTGGYTGNVYHEFNDGLIPLYITAQRFGGEVVLVVLEYHSWWMTKYGSIVKKLTNYKLVDFSKDRRIHCFSEMIVGLKIHGELTVDPQLIMNNGKGIHDFQALLRQGLLGGSQQEAPSPAPLQQLSSSVQTRRPKLAIFIRNQGRVLQNLKEIIKICQKVGFDVQILNPKRTTQLSEIFAALDSSDAMLAVHGAAMTHFLFMRPGSVLIQIVPLGLDWAADAYYGEPARKLGLDYMAYKVFPEESSLYKEYGRRDPVIREPGTITRKGWSETKRIYLDRQNVRVNLRRFSRLITKVHAKIVSKLHARV